MVGILVHVEEECQVTPAQVQILVQLPSRGLPFPNPKKRVMDRIPVMREESPAVTMRLSNLCC
jgi:hypothetical protein